MSGSKQQFTKDQQAKLEAMQVEAALAMKIWKAGIRDIGTLDKDVWHNIKDAANIKKTKWYQSSSSIGPKIQKAQQACADFTKSPNKASFDTATKSLESLKKETKDFWSKHKEAQNPQVKTALKQYEDAAEEALKALQKIAGYVPKLDVLDRSHNLKKVYDDLHIT